MLQCRGKSGSVAIKNGVVWFGYPGEVPSWLHGREVTFAYRFDRHLDAIGTAVVEGRSLVWRPTKSRFWGFLENLRGSRELKVGVDTHTVRVPSMAVGLRNSRSAVERYLDRVLPGWKGWQFGHGR